MSGSKFLPMDVPLSYTARDISRELQASGVRKRHVGCSRPWRTAKALLDALRSLALPVYPGEETLRMRSCSSSLASILPQEQCASPFHMWHDDLHEENIFVDANDPTVIMAIIDWQSTCIVPLFDHTVLPGFLDYDGPVVQGMERPKPPPLTEITDPKEKAAALKLYDEQILASGYKHMLEGNIKPVFDAVMYEESETSDVLSASRNLFEVGEAYCLGSIAALESSPIQFSEVELAKIQEDVEKTAASMNVMNVIKDALGPLFPERGCVRPGQYVDSKAALRRVKHQVVEDFSSPSEDRRIWEEVWPFDD